MVLTISLSILAFWYWRFKDVPIDRDYCPYAYPAFRGTGYLRNGHTDIKPPLIHWSYTWLANIFTPQKSNSLAAWLRIPPFLGMSLAVCCLAISGHTAQALALALLFASPSLWGHMANTEWMTASLWAAALAVPWEEAKWFLIGATLLVNIKNALLLAPVALALGLLFTPISPAVLWGVIPLMLAFTFLLLTGRAGIAYQWVFKTPRTMGKARTLRINTLSSFHLLKPGLYVFAPFLASMDYTSPWALVALSVVAVAILSKQIVPHHFILLALPVAMAWAPSVGSLFAFAIVFGMREIIPYLNPATMYQVTFAGKQGGHYGLNLDDGAYVTNWLKANTDPSETIWINGWENQIYLNANRAAWQIQVPELLDPPKGQPPRVIVHCQGAIEFDYAGYDVAEVSPGRTLTIMTRE